MKLSEIRYIWGDFRENCLAPREGLGHCGRNILFLAASPPLRIPDVAHLFYFDFDRFHGEDKFPETSASFLARDQRYVRT